MADASSVPSNEVERAKDVSPGGADVAGTGTDGGGVTGAARSGAPAQRRPLPEGAGLPARGGAGPDGAGPGGFGPRHRRTLGAGRVWIGRLARGGGELLITAGVVVALFLGYQLWATNLLAGRTQDRLHHQLEQTWSRPAPAPPGSGAPRMAVPPLPAVPLGDGVAILRVPRLGRDYAPVVVEGVSAADLRRGPGHIPGTAMPGQIGNFVVSGHRTTYGKPFNRLDELKVGDALVVEVRDRYYTYRVTGSEVVTPNRLDVTYPVPKRPGVAPTKSLLTLTTCHPKYSASHRLVVYGGLVGVTEKSAGLPPALAAG
ncbi:class E sortase [Frankia sp. AiPa1]|uniref:class E sortase n=1 Tax=Frankia sp. AiPa1 TaxID=573492 RepID=UPI00202AE500|nr:class E sortase [Frankia sp. AiPa1]MCL9761720.1 class E sortase [Frankia sp. AiPa1]